MKSKIKKILEKNEIFEWSICDFSVVSDRLFPCRAKDRLPKLAKSIIIAAFPYKVKEESPKNISRYAAVPDYHDVVGKMLENAVKDLRNSFPDNDFEWFTDNSPIPEVDAAAASSLGVKGKNGLLIHKKYGSFVFLGEIVTDLELVADKGFENCLDCGRCISSCHSVTNKETCLSAVTQQKKALSDAQIMQIYESGSCWGCDKCSEVCPMNKDSEITYIKSFIEGYRDSFSKDENRSGRAYNWRGPEVINRNYDIISSKKDKN